MQFAYASAYRGGYKIKQYISIILLQGCSRRPLILLGHSMDGIVIAKAICLAERETSEYPDIYESIAGCVFFGTPFKGADVAKIADYWAKLNKESGIVVNSQLVELLKLENDDLRELKGDFVKTSGKLATKVELFCFYKQQPTSLD
ncbi:hypothetical protein FHL15_010544 [Xylaria flabelliformis]|uniref:DUF676 domain-containing protein n=1 Tax=Xylaria flabelliformis TaxID=2512241 RepID=A0A553HKX6_9PEZI|nr:hypothetical protein FHL15_010544 [Xylaria flabelliformis]